MEEAPGHACCICFEVKDLWKHGCEHPFCSECMRSHAQSCISSKAFTEEGLVRHPCGVCSGGLSEDALASILDQDALNKYKRFVYEQQVAKDPSLYWCPNSGCVNVIKRNKTERRLKCDKCNTRFCSLCGNAHSVLVSCSLADVRFQAWRLFAGKPGEGIKRCPSCRYFIEKNEGCHHMTCRSCHYQFCWICGAEWHNHKRGGRQVVCGVLALHGELRAIHARGWEKMLHNGMIRAPLRVTSELVVTPVAVAVAVAGIGCVVAGGAVFIVVAPPVLGVKLLIKNIKRRRRQRDHERQLRLRRPTANPEPHAPFNPDVAPLVLRHGIVVRLPFTSTSVAWRDLKQLYPLGVNELSVYTAITEVNNFATVLHFLPADGLTVYTNSDEYPTIDFAQHFDPGARVHTVQVTLFQSNVIDPNTFLPMIRSCAWGVVTTYGDFPFDEHEDIAAFERIKTAIELAHGQGLHVQESTEDGFEYRRESLKQALDIRSGRQQLTELVLQKRVIEFENKQDQNAESSAVEQNDKDDVIETSFTMLSLPGYNDEHSVDLVASMQADKIDDLAWSEGIAIELAADAKGNGDDGDGDGNSHHDDRDDHADVVDEESKIHSILQT